MKKTLSLVIGLIICALLMPGKSNAQVVSSSDELDGYSFVPFADNGNGEYASGTLTAHILTGPQFFFLKCNVTGELTGETTGTVYRVVGVLSSVETNDYQVVTMVIRMIIFGKGEKYDTKGILHITNVNGVPVAEVIIGNYDEWPQ
jgi:hypothetical protein